MRTLVCLALLFLPLAAQSPRSSSSLVTRKIAKGKWKFMVILRKAGTKPATYVLPVSANSGVGHRPTDSLRVGDPLAPHSPPHEFMWSSIDLTPEGFLYYEESVLPDQQEALRATAVTITRDGVHETAAPQHPMAQ